MRYWLVNSCVQRDSKLMPGERVWHLEFVDLKTQERRVTYVERRFKNYNNWQSVISRYPRGLIVTNLEEINGKRINADSKPEIVFDVDASELADLLAEHWNK